MKVFLIVEWIDKKVTIGGIFDAEIKAWNACVNNEMLYVEMEMNRALEVGVVIEMPWVHPFSNQKFNPQTNEWEPYEQP